MNKRKRKNLLIDVLRFRGLTTQMKPEEVARFETMYRRARTQEEQDQVTSALRHFIDGWRDSDDAFSRLLRDAFDLEDSVGDEDALPPSLEAAIKRASVDLSKESY